MLETIVRPFVASPQQKRFFGWVQQGNGSAILQAVAGAGKTTTLVKALRLTRGFVTFCAFNKAIADEITVKVAAEDPRLASRVKCSTFHGLGYRALKRARPEFQDHSRLNEDARRAQLFNAVAIPEEAATLTFNVFDLARQRGYDPQWIDASWMMQVITHFNLFEAIEDTGYKPDDIAGWALELLREAAKPGHNFIDYSDMIWLPVTHGYKPFQADWLFVDEAQDTNPSRRMLARMALKPEGRAVFVGDRHQAIYGFTGADADAFDIIAEDFQAAELPLTITYRCPQAVVRHAQNWVSHIQAADTAPEGIVREGTAQEILRNAKLGDAIICRNTAPIVQLAFGLIRKGKRAHVEGRDIGKGLLALTRKWKDVTDADAFIHKLTDWGFEQKRILIEQKRNLAAQVIDDKVETLRVLAEDCATVDEIQEKIGKIFDNTTPDEARNRITLCTIHRSKGREWKKVFWLGHKSMCPSSFACVAWEQEQEINLMYVCATRAMEELVLAE